MILIMVSDTEFLVILLEFHYLFIEFLPRRFWNYSIAFMKTEELLAG
jgi:hypothetical protein